MNRMKTFLTAGVILTAAFSWSAAFAQEADESVKMVVQDKAPASEDLMDALDQALTHEPAPEAEEVASSAGVEKGEADEDVVDQNAGEDLPFDEETLESDDHAELLLADDLLAALESRCARKPACESNGCPMKQIMMKALLEKTVVPTPDGGVIVLAGNKIIKYDQYLNVIKEAEISVDVEALRQDIMAVMSLCPETSGCPGQKCAGVRKICGAKPKICPIALPSESQTAIESTGTDAQE